MSELHKNSRLIELEIEKKELEIRKTEKEINKIDSEKEKIELESRDLKKQFYKKPQWWAFFTTFVVSIFTLITLYANGTFKSTKAKTEADFSILKLEKKEFEIEKDKAKKEFEIEKKKMDSILKKKTDSLNAYNQDLTQLRSTNNDLIGEKINILKNNNQLKSEINSLKDSVSKNLVEKQNTIELLKKIRDTIDYYYGLSSAKEKQILRSNERQGMIVKQQSYDKEFLRQLLNLKTDSLKKCREDLLKYKVKQ